MKLNKLTAIASLTLLSGSLLAAPMPDEVRHDPMAPSAEQAPPPHGHDTPNSAEEHHAAPDRSQPEAHAKQNHRFKRPQPQHKAHKIHRHNPDEPHN